MASSIRAVCKHLGVKDAGVVDWKASFAEIVGALWPQLRRLGYRRADWDWTLEARWDGVGVDRRLEAAGAALAERGHVLGALDLPADSHVLVALDRAAWKKLGAAARRARVPVIEWRGKRAPARAAAPRRLRVDRRAVPFAGYHVGTGGDWIVFSDRGRTLWVDTAKWPPRTILRPLGTSNAARRADGRWLCEPEERGAPLRVHPAAGAAPTSELTVDPPVRRFDALGWLGSRAAGVTSTYATDGPVAPYLQQGSTLRHAPGIRPRPVRSSDHGIVPLGRTSIIVWGGDGWELRGGRLVRTFRLRVGSLAASPVPATRDTFFYLDGDALFEARRGARPVRHLRDLAFSGLAAGPDSTLLLWDISSRDGTVATLYHPRDRWTVRIDRRHIGHDSPTWMFWAPRGRRLYVGAHARQLWSIAGDALLALPRG